jgi:hypothetical protein
MYIAANIMGTMPNRKLRILFVPKGILSDQVSVTRKSRKNPKIRRYVFSEYFILKICLRSNFLIEESIIIIIQSRIAKLIFITNELVV